MQFKTNGVFIYKYFNPLNYDIILMFKVDEN